MLGQEAVVKQSGVPPWWSMVVSASGIIALFSSHALQLSEATYPIIAMMIAAGPVASVDQLLRRRQDGDGDE